MPAMPMPSSASAPPALTHEAEVTISAEDLDRLHLKFGTVTEGAVMLEVRVPGTVQPNAYKQVHVTPLVGGVVTEVAAELGQTVKRGQALVQLFSRDLAEAQTAYVTFSVELEAEHKKLLRTQELVRFGAAISFFLSWRHRRCSPAMVSALHVPLIATTSQIYQERGKSKITYPTQRRGSE